jgi:peroxiredoxin
MPRSRLFPLILMLFACTALADGGRPKTVASLRDAFKVPADATVSFLSEDGATLTEAEFSKRLPSAANVKLIKNVEKGTYTLALAKPTEFRKPAPITSLPPIDFTDLSGKRIRNADLAGKPTLVSFFFATCAPCIREIPAFNAFRRKHPEYNYLAVTFDDTETAKGFVKEHSLEWPVAANASEFLKAAGITAYPTYLLLSASGAIAGDENGFDSTKNDAEAVAVLEKWTADSLRAKPWQPLLDTKLSNFNVYLSYRGDQIMSVLNGTAPKSLKPVGLNPPGQTVFAVSDKDGKPELRITGEYYGCLVTKQSYDDFHFVARVKWGEKKWEPRLTELKDSGILYHSRGDFGVDYWKSWALSQEFQVIEHGMGEYWSQATSAIDIRANPKKPGEEAPRWDSKAPWMKFGSANPGNNHALAGSDQDKPGQWVTLELICIQDDCVHVVNGKVVMALANSRYKKGEEWIPMTGGTLQIQSESAEVFYRDIAIRPIAAMPEDYADYFK